MARDDVAALLENPRTRGLVERLEKIRPLTCYSVDKSNPLTVKQIVYVWVTFKEDDDQEAKKLLGFCIVNNSSERMITGNPTLDALGYVSDRHVIQLSVLDLQFPHGAAPRRA